MSKASFTEPVSHRATALELIQQLQTLSEGASGDGAVVSLAAQVLGHALLDVAKAVRDSAGTEVSLKLVPSVQAEPTGAAGA